ncbi:MAG: hypothetical protein M2R45_02054 [Verrucomicrobia subdivision 3 bacterium]|nr:hypothetical protein [Limisphaerales bacterium]MCS1414874.1 hypothetical protein [Limisphaerales bacterium]
MERLSGLVGLGCERWIGLGLRRLVCEMAPRELISQGEWTLRCLRSCTGFTTLPLSREQHEVLRALYFHTCSQSVLGNAGGRLLAGSREC